MVGLLGAGFNCSLLCFGESGSGKSFTLAGEGLGQPGVIHMVINDLFVEVDELERNGMYGRKDSPVLSPTQT